jgi:hypothetical protein
VAGAADPPSLVGGRRPIEERRQLVRSLPQLLRGAAVHFSDNGRLCVVTDEHFDLVAVIADEDEMDFVWIVACDPMEPALVVDADALEFQLCAIQLTRF